MKQSHKTLAVYMGIGLLFVSTLYLSVQGAKRAEEIKFTEFVSTLSGGKVANVDIKKVDSRFEFRGKLTNGEGFITYGDMSERTEGMLLAANEANKEFVFNRIADDGPGPWIYVLNALPVLILVGFLFLLMRQLNSTNGRAMSFGKSRAKLQGDSLKKVTFADVAGVEEAKDELREVVEFLKNPKKFTRLGGKIPKGVLLMGQPGTGKTLLARAVAGEAGVPFFSIAGSDFVEMFVGVGASRVRDMFEQGKKSAPCIIFIDEIDAVGRHRGAGMGGGHDEREQTLNQILVEMDGFEENEGLIIIAATNRPDVLDPAIMRPGRFDRRVVVPLPDLRGREQILAVHIEKVPQDSDVDIEILARGTPGMSGADLANLVNEAALTAARNDKTSVNMKDFEEARDKVMMGPERRSMIMSKNELENTAYHEAGHALVGLLLGEDVDPVHKVTIIPRGRALGVTMQLPEDRMSYTKEYALNRIAVLMGGRIAEEQIFGKYTTGASNDIEQATSLARNMVCKWGMSEELGPLNFGGPEREVFLGRDYGRQENVSQETAELIDSEIRRIVREQYQRAEEMLAQNQDKLELLSKALLEYETIDAADIDTLMSGGEITRAKPTIRLKTREDLEEERARRKGGIAGGVLPSGASA